MDKVKVAQELVSIAKSLVAGDELFTKFSPFYMEMLRRVGALPWEGRARKNTSSAINSISGMIRGQEVSFDWQAPSKRWGPTWTFLGVSIGGATKFDTTASMLMEKTPTMGNRPIDWIRWVRDGEQGLDDALTKRNLEEFSKAIEYVSKM